MNDEGPGSRSGKGAASARHVLEDERKRKLKASRSKHLILVVDDHEVTLYATVRILSNAGFRTSQTIWGEEAIGLANDVSAVVLDVNLPDRNGIEVLSAIRKGPIPALPVVLTSAVYIDELHRGVAMNSGADAYLIAPLDAQELIATLDQLLLV